MQRPCPSSAVQLSAGVRRAFTALQAVVLAVIQHIATPPALAESLNGTSIVVVRTPSEIVVAADSLIHALGPDSRPFTLCKINQLAGFYFSPAKLVADTSGSYNVARLMLASYQPGFTMRDTALLFELNMLEPLRFELEKVRRDYPSDFEEVYIDETVADIAVFGIEASTPVLLLRSFRCSTDQSGSIVITPLRRDCPGPDCPDGTAFVALGSHDVIDQALAADPGYLGRTALPDALCALVELQKRADPSKVGGPTNVLRLTADGGVHWILRSPECVQ